MSDSPQERPPELQRVMHKRGRSAEASCSRDSRGTPQPAAHIRLEDLPSEAVELIAQHASTPSTPAACLLPLVCRGWSTAADSVQLLVDINVDLGPHRHGPHNDVDAASCLRAHHFRATRAAAAAEAAAEAAAAAAVHAALLRARQLAAWLAKRRGSVRSLCITIGDRLISLYKCRQGWEQDLGRISKALTAGPPMPHLVHLELPVLVLPGSSAFLKALAACTGLQRLVLQGQYPCWSYGIRDSVHLSLDQVGAALAPLRQLRCLNLEWPFAVDGAWLAGLLWQLPPSLEQLQLLRIRCHPLTSIPLSCITHLVHLRAWELHDVPLVEDDISSSSNSSSGGGTGCAICVLPALTSMRCGRLLQGRDARLLVPNLRSLQLSNGAEPEAWPLLQGMKNLRQLSICTSKQQDLVGLSGMTQVQDLSVQLLPIMNHADAPDYQSWATTIASLTQLTTLFLPVRMVVAGGPALLTPLTRLEQLTVDCRWQMPDSELVALDPVGVQGPCKVYDIPGCPLVGDAVKVVAAAVKEGWRPLQRLVVCPRWPTLGGPRAQVVLQHETAAAEAALPGVQVDFSEGQLLYSTCPPK